MKAKIVSVIVVILALVVGIGSYFIHKNIEENKSINKEIEKVSQIKKEFTKESQHKKRLDILKKTMSEMKTVGHSSKVSNKYKSVIFSMQRAMEKEYDLNIEENTLNDLDSIEDIDAITKSKNNLMSLLALIKTEKKYTLSKDDFENYKSKITELIESDTKRITDLEEVKKQAEEAKKQAEEEAKKQVEEEEKKSEEAGNTHYENEYFSVDVPTDWVGYWSVTEQDNSLPEVLCKKYTFSYMNDDTPEEDNGGADVYIIDMTNTEVSFNTYRSLIPDVPDTSLGTTSTGIEVFDIEAGAGFFHSKATITLK